MKLIVGLGNPGREYDMTRHNAGFMVVDLLARRHAPGAIPRSKFGAGLIEAVIPEPPEPPGPPDRSARGGGGRSGDRSGGDGPGDPARCLLAQPTTFMNRSGRTVGEAVRFYKLDPAQDVLVITDDLALPVGAIRLRASGGSGGHNGLADIERVLGTDAFARLRVGIGAKPAGMNQADYVLSRFHLEEHGALDEALGAASDAAACWANRGAVAAMNRFNTRVKKPEKPKPDPKPKPEANPEAKPEAGTEAKPEPGPVSGQDRPASG